MRKKNIVIFATAILLLISLLVACNGEADVNLIFIVDGEVYETIDRSNVEVTLPQNPIKEGYTFNGWYAADNIFSNGDTPTTIPSGDLVFDAKWTLNQYTISFVSNGGSEVLAIIQDYGTDVLAPVEPIREGYTFNGWFADNNTFLNEYTFTTIPSNDLTLYAKWTINNYTISFNANGGSEVDSITKEYGTALPAFDNPIKDYHTFSGWYTDNQTFESEFTFSTMPAQNITLYAKWTAYKYTLSFVTNGGSEVDSITKDYGTNVISPVEPTKEGYTFKGWFIDNNTFLNEYTFTTIPSNNVELYAKWTINNYTISFNANDGSEVDSITQDYGTEVVAPTCQKEGYSLDGWYDETLTTKYDFTTMPADDFTLYAKWTINKYIISFVANGGSEVDSISKDYGQDVVAPTNPQKEGYTFNGWYTDNGTFSNEYTFTTIPSKNVELYAKWTINEYTLSFNANGGSEVDSITQDYDTELPALNNPNKDYHTFSGWYTDNNTFRNGFTYRNMPAQNITLYAKWEANTYTLSFDTNCDSEIVAITKAYGAALAAPVSPIREGYRLDGWYDEALTTKYDFTTMPAYNFTLYAKWTINEYTISFNANGGSEVDSITQDYDTALPAFNDSSKDYHTFNGWYTDNGTFESGFTFSAMPAKNITLYAKWAPNKYNVVFYFWNELEQVYKQEDEIEVTYQEEISISQFSKEGYSIDLICKVGDETRAWDSNAIMPGYDLEVYGNYIINQYTILFNSRGGSIIPSIKQDYGTQVVAPTDPTKTGHTFSGWYTDNNSFENEYIFTTIPASKVILYAKWTVNQYTISFVANGGSEVGDITQDFGTEVVVPTYSIKEGYSLDGWYDETLTSKYDFTTMPSNDLTLYAKWTINQYTISFNANGGSATVAIIQDYGTEVVAPNDPTKTGHTFSGWYTDNNSFANKYIFTTIPANNFTLHAKWTVNQYTISFVANGGSEVGDITQDFGTEVVVPTYSIKEGYSLDGWYDETLTSKYTFTTMPSNDLTLYAKWTINQYTISFNANGGSATVAIIQDYGTEVVAPNDPTKTGHTFSGWYTDNNSFANKYIFTTIPANNFTLHAKWTVNQYTISFVANGGSEVGDITQDFGTEVVVPTYSIKEGYSLDGWYDETLTSKYTFTTMPSNDLTLYAKWTINQYTISFNANGGSATVAIIQDYGTEVVAPNDPTKTGHTFSGWYNETLTSKHNFTTMPANNFTLYAKWTVNQYTISFVANGGSEVGDITQDFGTEVVVPSYSIKEGYSFDGWYDDTLTTKYNFTTMPSNDLTLYAKWTINQYTISFNANGGSEVDSITRDYNAEVVAPTEPQKEGYTFNGWYTDNNSFANEYIFTTIPANNFTLHAKWTVNQYTISFVANGGSQVGDITQDFGTIIYAPIDPTKDHYTFNGWYTDNNTFLDKYIFTTIPSRDVELYAKWTVNQYTISFVANGGSEVAEITQDYGTEVVSPTDSNKTGHTFNGWYIDNNTFVNKYTFTTMPANGRVLYAKWTINQYIISFNANGGSQVNNITQDYGTVLPALDNSSKDYHTFNGWYTDNGTFKIKFSLSTMPANDVDLYAKWTANPYTISFETDGGSEIEAITQAYGTYLTAPTSIKAGYSLDGWYYDETLKIKYNFTTMPGYDFTLYARWTVNSYTISFDTNGGSVVEAITQDFGTELVIPNNPLKEGCVFKGWFTDNETFKDEYTFETVPNESFTLYAKWAKIYTITFDSNGGSEITEINTAVGDVLIAPDIPTKMGYTFNGWHTDNYTFLEEYEFSIMPEGSFTLYAKWLWSGQTLYAANGYYRIENCIWFGEYPQTLKASNITITETTDSRGYYLGSDGYYYSKVTATPHAKVYKFSSNETVTSGTIYYFKVEPIKWRILNESEGTALILCDSIIKNKHYSYNNDINDVDNNSNDYMESEIRAWLNNEFYTTAFNTLQQGLINTTSIDNSPKSTGYMDNPYTCDNTEDKIFLPSYSEMVNADYCFNNDNMVLDTARRRLTSDYSRATGVIIKTDIDYYGNGYWWLRSPYIYNGYTVSFVAGEGHIGGSGGSVDTTSYGIVPALVISLPNQD